MTTLSTNTYGPTARHGTTQHGTTAQRSRDPARFPAASTIDRLMAVINLLGARVDVAVKVRMPRAA